MHAAAPCRNGRTRCNHVADFCQVWALSDACLRDDGQLALGRPGGVQRAANSEVFMVKVELLAVEMVAARPIPVGVFVSYPGTRPVSARNSRQRGRVGDGGGRSRPKVPPHRVSAVTRFQPRRADVVDGGDAGRVMRRWKVVDMVGSRPFCRWPRRAAQTGWVPASGGCVPCRVLGLLVSRTTARSAKNKSIRPRSAISALRR